jgi:RNA polymerase sigma-70 factor (ECF subfamily)
VTIEADLEAEYPWLRKTAAQFARTRATMDDLAQSAFLAAWGSRHQFKPGTNLRAWLYVILRNEWRTWQRHWRVTFDSELVGQLAEYRSQPPAQEHCVHLREVSDAIEKLAPVHRRALYRAANGEQIHEGRPLYGSPAGTQKSRLWRARRMIEALA